jgi:PAS domain-containing protein
MGVPMEITQNGMNENLLLTIVMVLTFFLFGIVMVYSKINQQKSCWEMKLKELRFQALYENNLDPIIVFDSKGRFVKANEIALNNPNNDLLKWLIHGGDSLVNETEHIKIEHHFIEALNGKANIFTFTFINKNGDEWFLLVKNIPIIMEGKSEGFFTIFHDLTEQKKTEKQLIEPRTD